MFFRFFSRLLLATSLALGSTAGLAQAPASATTKVKIEPRVARFSLVAPLGSNARWFEADIEVDTRVVGGRTQFADRVKVSLALGTRVLGGAYRFYRSEMEAVALESGSAHFRFYLPAEVVKRDGLGGEPEFWVVTVRSAGEPDAAPARSLSPSLREPERLRSFEAKIAAEASANDGVLQPQHLTPFATQYPLATPAPVRRNQ